MASPFPPPYQKIYGKGTGRASLRLVFLPVATAFNPFHSLSTRFILSLFSIVML